MSGCDLKQQTEAGVGKKRRKQRSMATVIVELRSEIDTLKEELSEQQVQKGQIESLSEEIGRLRRKNDTLAQQLREVSSEIKVLNDVIAEKDRVERSLKNDIDRLNEDMGQYKEEHAILIMSQAACLFEQAILSLIHI